MQSHLESKKKMVKKSSKGVESNLPDHDNRPSFSMFILHKGDASRSLEIPPHFVRTHLPKRIPTRAVLRGPSGDYWKITMCKQDRSTIMQHGWQQFYQNHCLGDKDFLVLRYNGNMCFDVQIFEKSGCERNCVSITRTHQDSTEKIKEEEMDLTDMVKTKSQVQIGGKAKKKSAEEKDLASSSRKRPAGRKITAKLCKAAKDFTSNFPHFKHCITRCNVDIPFLLTIPTSFLNAHLPQARTEFTFWTSKEKSWEVTLLYTDTNKVFSKCWRRFAVDNKLEMDDSCVFELVAPREMRVHIFPTERGNCSQLFVQV
ncbi:hypothetical protein POUND7_016467 [Theobroma cacao]